MNWVIYISGLMTLVASRSDDPDNSFTLDDEELNFDFNQEQTLQSGYHTIVESLADGNSRLVAEVRDFVEELRRVTLLWEELWLGSLIQIHHDFEKRENQLNDEIKRVNSSTSLSGQEKTALIKGKHIALMKPVSNLLLILRSSNGEVDDRMQHNGDKLQEFWLVLDEVD